MLHVGSPCYLEKELLVVSSKALPNTIKGVDIHMILNLPIGQNINGTHKDNIGSISDEA